MAAYDDLYIDANSLPISPQEKELLGEDPERKTENVVNDYTKVYITNRGELQYWSYDTDQLETIPFHGFVQFYTTTDWDKETERDWIFSAKFTNGKLVGIKRLDPAVWFYSRQIYYW